MNQQQQQQQQQPQLQRLINHNYIIEIISNFGTDEKLENLSFFFVIVCSAIIINQSLTIKKTTTKSHSRS